MSHGENMEKIKNKRKVWLCLPLCEAGMVCAQEESSVLLLGSARNPSALAQPTATTWGGTWWHSHGLCDTEVSLATWHQSQARLFPGVLGL